MPIDIQNVLVCDAVDQSCVELLKLNGISVDYKLKLPKDILVEEAKVKSLTFLHEPFSGAKKKKIKPETQTYS